MSTDTDRIENPHRDRPVEPLLAPHPFQPGRLAGGAALVALGLLFLGQQLGVVAGGAVPTVAALVVAGALLLVGAAVGGRHSSGSEEPARPDA